MSSEPVKENVDLVRAHRNPHRATREELSKEVIDKIPNITDHHQVQKVLDEEKTTQTAATIQDMDVVATPPRISVIDANGVQSSRPILQDTTDANLSDEDRSLPWVGTHGLDKTGQNYAETLVHGNIPPSTSSTCTSWRSTR